MNQCKSTPDAFPTELVPLCEKHNLYLKPIARVNLTVQLPTLHDPSGSVKSFTIWEIIEKLRRLCPVVLSPPTVIRVARTTLEFVRLVADVGTKADMKRVVTSLDSQYIKLSGFPQNLSVRACEAPADCPRRHDWEAFFRDAQDMNETEPGERPDTMILSGLPIRWFAAPDTDKPDPAIVQRCFEHFGPIRCVDIPLLDPVQNPDIADSFFNTTDEHFQVDPTTRSPQNSTTTTTTTRLDEKVGGFGKIGPGTISVIGTEHVAYSSSTHKSTQETKDTTTGHQTPMTPLTFTAYVQFADYQGFLKAMTALHGQKLAYTPVQPIGSMEGENQVYYTAEIKVDFDRTKHLCRASILARQTERERLAQLARRRREKALAKAEQERRQRHLVEDANRKAEERRQAEKLAIEAERRAKEAARAERKKQRAMERCRAKKNELLKQKMKLDEQHRVLAIRKVESIRLVTFLLTRIQARHDALVERKRALRNSAKTESSTSSNHRTSSPCTYNAPQAVEPKMRQEDPQAVGDVTASTHQDAILEQLLIRREEFLRASLLKKRMSAQQTR